MFRMSTRGGMTVSAIMPTMFATGGRMVCARSPNTCKSGRPASNTVPSTSVRTGNRVMPSSVMIGMAWASPLLSISTNCMSIGSMVGQLSRMVLNRLSMTGVNRLPASAMNSLQMPLRSLVLFTRPPVLLAADCWIFSVCPSRAFMRTWARVASSISSIWSPRPIESAEFFRATSSMWMPYSSSAAVLPLM